MEDRAAVQDGELRERPIYHRHGMVFAMQGETYRHIDEVSSGLACRCTCDECSTPVIARKCTTKMDHFAHQAECGCLNTGERGLVHAAKQALEQDPRFHLPAYGLGWGDVEQDEVVVPIERVEAHLPRAPAWPELHAFYRGHRLRVVIRPTRRSTSERMEQLLSTPGSVLIIFVEADEEGAIYAPELRVALREPDDHLEGVQKLWLRNERHAAVCDRLKRQAAPLSLAEGEWRPCPAKMRDSAKGQIISASVEQTCPGCPFYLELEGAGYCLGEKRIGDLADLERVEAGKVSETSVTPSGPWRVSGPAAVVRPKAAGRTVIAELGRSFLCRRCNGSRPLVRVRGSALPHCGGCGVEYWG